MISRELKGSVMSTIGDLKAEAAALELKARTSGQSLKHCAALERVARSRGYSSWRACLAAQSGGAAADKPASQRSEAAVGTEMKRYTSRDWGFDLDIPKRWNAFPPVQTAENPFEVIRFASLEDGYHQLIVYRLPHDPAADSQASVDLLQRHLAKVGHGNFVMKSETVSIRNEFILDFEQQREELLYRLRMYSFSAGTLAYRLVFSSPRWDAMAGLFERMAESFEFTEE
jgi:hypothetical protein